jgi:excisionase family DNA binding protein
MNDTNYLTQDEAAKVMRLSPRTLERHRLTGTGPRFVKAGRRVLYRRSDLDAWADQHTFASTSEADAASGCGEQ